MCLWSSQQTVCMLNGIGTQGKLHFSWSRACSFIYKTLISSSNVSNHRIYYSTKTSAAQEKNNKPEQVLGLVTYFILNLYDIWQRSVFAKRDEVNKQMSFNQANVNSTGTDAWSCLPHELKSGMSFAPGADTELPILIVPASLRSKYIYILPVHISDWDSLTSAKNIFCRKKMAVW